MVHNTISEYLSALNEWNNTPARIINGEMVCWVGGKWVSNLEFKNKYPKPVYEPMVKDNPDGTRISASIKIKKQ